MTSSKQPHCEHECVCVKYIHGSPVARVDGTPCMRNHTGCRTCEHDTRTSHSSATEPDANNLQTFPFSAVCCRKCSDHEPTCHDICGAYQTERDAAIREQAKREERHRVLKALHRDFGGRRVEEAIEEIWRFPESLRGGRE